MELSAEERTNINKIAQKNGYTNFKIKVEKGSNKGDNFVGIISRVTIEDNDEKFDVILKSTQKIEALKKVQPTRKLFLREIYLYEKIFADYAAFEEEYNVPDRFSAHAKLLGTCEKEDDEHLILEDMKQKGYGMWNKRVTMNSNHIEAVLKEYGKFHSISLAMNKLRPEHFHELTKDLDEVFGGEEGKQQEMTEFMKNLMKNAYKAVEGDQEAVEAIKKYEQTLPDIFKNINDDDNIVVTHGDCWCNNFLFKYQGNNTEKPAEICILDWQLSKLGSPGMDLCYFLFANGSEEVLNNYQKYLKIYYDTVSERLTYFSCKSDEILTFEQLEQMFRRCCKFFFAFCTMIMRIQMSESHEVPEFSDNVEKEEMFDTFANFTISNEDEFNRRMAILTRFMMKYSMF